MSTFSADRESAVAARQARELEQLCDENAASLQRLRAENVALAQQLCAETAVCQRLRAENAALREQAVRHRDTIVNLRSRLDSISEASNFMMSRVEALRLEASDDDDGENTAPA